MKKVMLFAFCLLFFSQGYSEIQIREYIKPVKSSHYITELVHRPYHKVDSSMQSTFNADYRFYLGENNDNVMYVNLTGEEGGHLSMEPIKLVNLKDPVLYETNSFDNRFGTSMSTIGKYQTVQTNINSGIIISKASHKKLSKIKVNGNKFTDVIYVEAKIEYHGTNNHSQIKYERNDPKKVDLDYTSKTTNYITKYYEIKAYLAKDTGIVSIEIVRLNEKGVLEFKMESEIIGKIR